MNPIYICFKHHHVQPCEVCERESAKVIPIPMPPQRFLPSKPDPNYFRDLFNETKRWLDVE